MTQKVGPPSGAAWPPATPSPENIPPHQGPAVSIELKAQAPQRPSSGSSSGKSSNGRSKKYDSLSPHQVDKLIVYISPQIARASPSGSLRPPQRNRPSPVVQANQVAARCSTPTAGSRVLMVALPLTTQAGALARQAAPRNALPTHATNPATEAVRSNLPGNPQTNPW